jgi:hypothetical protein
MANKNFIVKNGLEVGGQEVVSSSGVITSAALGGQTLSSTDSPTFNNLTLTNDIAVGGDLNLTGDLNITGDVNSLSVTDLDVTDQTITLGAGQVESASGGSGIVVDGSNASILWDETNDEWDFNKAINVTGTIDSGAITSTGAITAKSGGGFYLHPTDAHDTDAWILYQYTDNTLRYNFTGAGADEIIIKYPNATNATTLLVDTEQKRVGIGTDSPDAPLHIGSSSVGSIKLNNANLGNTTIFPSYEASASYINSWLHGAGAGPYPRYVDVVANGDSSSGGNIRLLTNPSGSATAVERMRIDSSGNLLVGTTDDSLYNNGAGGNTGVLLRGSVGNIQAARSGGAPIDLNRLDGDGDIAVLQKDGLKVGSIGTNAGVLTIGNNNSGGIIFGYSGSHTFIEPSNTSGASVDDGATLGSSSKRFRDLYLSSQAIIEDESSSPSILVKAASQTNSTTPTASIILSSGSLSSNASAPAIISYRDADYSTAALRSSGLKFQVTKSNAGSEAMWIDSSGNVGIGHTPTYALDITGEIDDQSPLLRGTASNTSSSHFNWISEFLMPNLSGGHRVVHAIGTARSNANAATIGFFKHASATGYNAFNVGLFGNNDILNVCYNGNVGIGTQTPDSKLTVNGQIESLKDSYNEGGQLILRAPSSVSSSKRFNIDTFALSGASTMRFFSEDDSNGANGAVHMYIKANGYVGINTVPNYQLDVRGQNSGTNGHMAYIENNGGGGNGCTFSVQHTDGNHSWGVVQELRIQNGSGTDNPSILFSSGTESTNTWTVGYGYTDNNFRIKRDHGYHNGNWGTSLFTMDRSGNLTIGGSLTENSDERLKENITTIPNALDKVSQLRGVTFDWKERDDEGNVRSSMGFIAQEVEAVEGLEILVTEVAKDGSPEMEEFQPKGVIYQNMVGLLVESIKEQQTIIEDLKSRLDEAGL